MELRYSLQKKTRLDGVLNMSLQLLTSKPMPNNRMPIIKLSCSLYRRNAQMQLELKHLLKLNKKGLKKLRRNSKLRLQKLIEEEWKPT